MRIQRRVEREYVRLRGSYSPSLADPYNIVDIRELKLLAEFKHPNIVRLVSYGSTFASS
jgi:hypothetical protein